MIESFCDIHFLRSVIYLFSIISIAADTRQNLMISNTELLHPFPAQKILYLDNFSVQLSGPAINNYSKKLK